MDRTFVERRQKRSEALQTALEYQLEACARRAKIDTLVLADEGGLLVAATGNRSLFEQLAAISTFVGAPWRWWNGEIEHLGQRRNFSVVPVIVGQEQLYMAAFGGEPTALDRELICGTEGITRIISRAA